MKRHEERTRWRGVLEDKPDLVQILGLSWRNWWINETSWSARAATPTRNGRATSTPRIWLPRRCWSYYARAAAGPSRSTTPSTGCRRSEVVAGWAEQVPEGLLVRDEGDDAHHAQEAVGGHRATSSSYVCLDRARAGRQAGPDAVSSCRRGSEARTSTASKTFLAIAARMTFQRGVRIPARILVLTTRPTTALKDAGAGARRGRTRKNSGEPPLEATADVGLPAAAAPDLRRRRRWTRGPNAAQGRSRGRASHVFFKHEEEGAGPALAADFSGRFA